MKKFWILVLLGFFVSACSSSSTGTMTCTVKNDQDQMSSMVTMKFEYQDNIVTAQANETEITTTTADAYEQLKALVDSSQEVFKTITGTSYNVEVNENTYTIKEFVTIDFSKISDEDRAKILSYDGDMDIDQIKDSLQAQSYTCQK